MKIKVLHQNGWTIPVIFCEICDKRIEKGEQAEYLIGDQTEGDYGKVIVGHSKCTYAWEGTQPDSWGNMSLAHLLVCLVTNTGTEYEKEKKFILDMEAMY